MRRSIRRAQHRFLSRVNNTPLTLRRTRALTLRSTTNSSPNGLNKDRRLNLIAQNFTLHQPINHRNQRTSIQDHRTKTNSRSIRTLFRVLSTRNFRGAHRNMFQHQVTHPPQGAIRPHSKQSASSKTTQPLRMQGYRFTTISHPPRISIRRTIGRTRIRIIRSHARQGPNVTSRRISSTRLIRNNLSRPTTLISIHRVSTTMNNLPTL